MLSGMGMLFASVSRLSRVRFNFYSTSTGVRTFGQLNITTVLRVF